VPEDDVPPATRRWRLDVAYDGSGFRGFAAQPAAPTVAGALSGALAQVLRLAGPPRLTCAGRTDAGVHARGQVVHVDLPAQLPKVRRGRTWAQADGEDLVRLVNRVVAPAVVVRRAAPAPPGFDARRSATWRRYRYLVWNAPVPDPLLAPVSWHVPDRLEVRRMAGASDVLVGEHDFRAFCRRAPGTGADDPIVRRILSAEWEEAGTPVGSGAGPGSMLRFEIAGTSFCHQMVRSVVGLLVEVGLGGADAAVVNERVRSGRRAGAPRPAPAHGLCLVAVGYD